MVKKIIYLIMLICLTSSVLAYGGSSFGVSVFKTEMNDNDNKYSITSFKLKKSASDININCIEGKLDSSRGDKKVKCSDFNYLMLDEKINYIDVYISNKDAYIKTDEYSYKGVISIDNIEYEFINDNVITFKVEELINNTGLNTTNISTTNISNSTEINITKLNNSLNNDFDDNLNDYIDNITIDYINNITDSNFSLVNSSKLLENKEDKHIGFFMMLWDWFINLFKW